MAKYTVELSYEVKDHKFETTAHIDAATRDAAIERIKSHFTSLKAKNIVIKHAKADSK